MAELNTYLSFTENCEDAFTFYKSVFGGEFQTFSRFGDNAEMKSNAAEANKVMHVSLPIGKKSLLMGSDTPAQMGSIITGNNFSIAIHPESEEEATRLFNGLSEGGKIFMPLSKTFWNSYFGMFTDKFGINWMVNYDLGQQK